MADPDNPIWPKRNTFHDLIHEVDYTANKLLHVFRTEMSDEEAVFINSFCEMNLYDRQEMLLHFIIVLSHHLDAVQDQIDTIAPVVADVADLLFTLEKGNVTKEE
jgi:hypothetical protein